MQGVGVNITYFRAMQLQYVGLFFNSSMPGAVGGDLIKAYYVLKESRSNNKTSTLLTILLDRILGMIGLFFIGTVGVSFALLSGNDHPVIRMLSLFVFGVFAILICFVGYVLIPFKDRKDPIAGLLQGGLPIPGIFHKIYEGLLLFRSKPKIIVTTIFLSALIQGSQVLFLWVLVTQLPGASIDLAGFLVATPVGLLITALPIAPGGLGVGHAAFERLYQVAGGIGGATVFNTFFIGQMSLNLTGVIAYLFVRSKVKDIDVSDLSMASLDISTAKRGELPSDKA